MTDNKQHIKNLKKLKSFHNGSYGADIDRSIKALEQEPCEDCISRQSVIDDLEKSHMTSGVHNQGTWNECVDSMIHTVKAMPSVNPQKSGWIPISERLPEKDGDYLLFGKVVEDDTEDTFIGMYDACVEKFGYWEDYYDSKTLGFLDSELIEYNKVIAWMPLPKPYKAESEE